MQNLTKPELITLLTTAKGDSERNYLMILTAFSHGLRVSEVVSLRKGVHVRDGFLSVQRLKGSLKTTQPLVPSTEPLLSERDALAGYLNAVTDGELLFPISRRRADQLIKKYAEKAGLPAHKRHMHCLKHSAAMTAIKGGVEICRQYLGHKSLASTGAYLRVSDEAASLAFAAAMGA